MYTNIIHITHRIINSSLNINTIMTVLGGQSRDCKLTVLGDSSVGKTTLIHSFVNDEYRPDFKPTLGTDISTKYLTIDGQQITVTIWDTAGTERFKSLSQNFYRGSQACILVADLTNIESFKNLKLWHQDIYGALPAEEVSTFPFVILANKSDLTDQRKVSPEQVKNFGEIIQCETFEVSAKNRDNVDDAFEFILKKYLENLRINPVRLEPNSIDIYGNNDNQNGGGCCHFLCIWSFLYI